MFGCGTGVVVVEVGEIQYNGQTYKIPSNPAVRLLRDTMTALQRGKIEHPWSFKVPEWEGVAKEGEMKGQESYA
jgi:branched-chain amino acid aminotransferase